MSRYKDLDVYDASQVSYLHYYREIVGAAKLPDPENPLGVRYAFSPTQFIEVLPLPDGVGIYRLDHTAWNTESAEGMRKYLAAKGWKTPSKAERGADGSRWFTVADPEGNKVQFVQPPHRPRAIVAPTVVGHHIIHIGFMVRSRATEDTFYRDLLGFRPYWWGGDTEDKVIWVSQQVPDGHDWLEYMLTAHPDSAGFPTNLTQHMLGVKDHFCIGEVSVIDTHKVLDAGNRLTGPHDGAPRIGRMGRYGFDLFDPDGIRLEVMNFHSSQKPCCSPLTAEDPSE